MVNAAYMHIGNHLTDDDHQNYPYVKINLILISMNHFAALEALT